MVGLLSGGRYVQKASQNVQQPIFDLPRRNEMGRDFYVGTDTRWSMETVFILISNHQHCKDGMLFMTINIIAAAKPPPPVISKPHVAVAKQSLVDSESYYTDRYLLYVQVA